MIFCEFDSHSTSSQTFTLTRKARRPFVGFEALVFDALCWLTTDRANMIVFLATELLEAIYVQTIFTLFDQTIRSAKPDAMSLFCRCEGKVRKKVSDIIVRVTSLLYA